ncbi:MAG: electron transfer flavoprotein subunit alpha/FixB family protein [Bacteroidales bacterium]|nr:electron transfer flavoprotein subunit alpha/FixB family protein [Bacteroidales bacterium]
MNNIIVYCETNGNSVAEVSLELLTKARNLAVQLKVKVEGILVGNDLKGLENQLFAHGANVVHKAEDPRLEFYQTLPHAGIVCEIMKKEQPQIGLFGATPVGRDLAPRVASVLKSGLTADCTSLEIGDHYEKKTDTTYKNLLYQIRPAFGGNIVATIINPETRPQLATVREGVMKREELTTLVKGKVKSWKVEDIVGKDKFVVEIIERHVEDKKVNIKGSQIIVAGGYGVGSKENFGILYQLADVLGGEVGGTRAAVDAGFIEHDRQIGQTGVTVRPKLYIACGISGQIQHRAGMMESSMIISINTDSKAPINSIADYVITGDFAEVVPKLIRYYRKNSK